MNKSLPFVSIGISFFNAESTLLDAVRSVFSQTHKSWELILIDDGSSDNSLKIARSIKDPRVRVYSDGENKKLATRLNQTITLSKYDFIARMDADDLMAPDRIEKQLRILVEMKNVDLVSTGVLSLNNENKPIGVRCVSKNHIMKAASVLKAQSGIVHASVLARKSWYERNNYREDLPVAEDSELWSRAYGKSDLKVYFIREPLYFYREDNNVTRSKLLKGYSVGRRNILKHTRYPVSLRFYIYIRSFSKTAIVFCFSSFGALRFLRKRRVLKKVSDKDYDFFSKTISNIKKTKISFY